MSKNKLFNVIMNKTITVPGVINKLWTTPPCPTESRTSQKIS